jgi:hypothetical protein
MTPLRPESWRSGSEHGKNKSAIGKIYVWDREFLLITADNAECSTIRRGDQNTLIF